MWNQLQQDEFGGVPTAETIVLGTILVLGMIVALVELQASMITEINDISNAAGNLSQSYRQAGMNSTKASATPKSRTSGASYDDRRDACDCDQSLSVVCDDPGETRKGTGS